MQNETFDKSNLYRETDALLSKGEEVWKECNKLVRQVENGLKPKKAPSPPPPLPDPDLLPPSDDEKESDNGNEKQTAQRRFDIDNLFTPEAQLENSLHVRLDRLRTNAKNLDVKIGELQPQIDTIENNPNEYSTINLPQLKKKLRNCEEQLKTVADTMIQSMVHLENIMRGRNHYRLSFAPLFDKYYIECTTDGEITGIDRSVIGRDLVEIIAQGTHEGFRRYQATPGEPATAVDKTKKTRRTKVEYREILRDAVKYYIDNQRNGVTRKDVEKLYKLSQGALSKDYPAGLIEEYERESIYSSKGVVVGERDRGKILVGHCRPSILSLTRLPTVRKQIPNRRLTA